GPRHWPTHSSTPPARTPRRTSSPTPPAHAPASTRRTAPSASSSPHPSLPVVPTPSVSPGRPTERLTSRRLLRRRAPSLGSTLRPEPLPRSPSDATPPARVARP